MHRDTYNIFRESVKRDLMRDLRDAESSRDLCAIGSLASPLQLDLAIVDGEQPVAKRRVHMSTQVQSFKDQDTHFDFR